MPPSNLQLYMCVDAYSPLFYANKEFKFLEGAEGAALVQAGSATPHTPYLLGGFPLNIAMEV